MTSLDTASATLKSAKTSFEVFGHLGGSTASARLVDLRTKYTALARMLHPDRHGGTKAAHDAMSLLNSWYERGQRDVEAGTWGKPAGATIKAKVTYSNVTPLAAGDVCDVFLGEYGTKQAVIKIARDPRDRDLVDNEARTLGDLWALTGKAAEAFQRYLPTPIEQTRIKVGGSERACNIMQFRQGGYTLREVIARHGGHLDARHVAWLWKRMLEIASWVHKQGIVHGGINPDHVLVFSENHGIHLLDWSYATKPGGKLRAISRANRVCYPIEALAKAPITTGVDVYMIAKCVIAMLGGNPQTDELPVGTPRPYAGLIHACLLAPHQRYQDAFEVHEALSGHLRSLFGPPKFIPMSM